jgi:hypothetical protein
MKTLKGPRNLTNGVTSIIMEDSTFERVDKSNKRMHGPKGILVCGYPSGEQQPLADALSQIGFADRPVIFPADGDAKRTLIELFSSVNRSGIGGPSSLPRAIIMSGFTQEELHILMNAYRNAGLPAQLWATLTPVSANWALEKLLAELSNEAEVFKNPG